MKYVFSKQQIDSLEREVLNAPFPLGGFDQRGEPAL